ncbi:Colicin I receptor [Burkholderiales bacterium]|nr:Colicin I receptor [Burkholderiales bacterium]
MSIAPFLRPLPSGIACIAAFSLAVSGTPVTAQENAAEVRDRLRVEVTGSHIPRPELESALPLQVITSEDIARSGATSVAGLMSQVSANLLGATDATTLGSFNPGLSSINLRGIGAGDTLVLLNGRRVANYAFDGSAVDVNAIPLAAIERIEILKDGASAIYGTDAVAGVVNFILRKSFAGLEVSGLGSWPEQGGGRQRQASVTAGTGDLVKDGYNLFATVTWQKDDPLQAIDRSFSRTGYLPDAGVIQMPPTTFPSNIFDLPSVRLYNPSFSSGCAPPYSLPVSSARTPGDKCGFDEAAYRMTLPQTERVNIYGRGTLRVAPDHAVYVELAWADTKFTSSVSPTPVAAFTNPGFESTYYPAGGPYYPTAFAEANGITGDLDLVYRTTPLGGRVSRVDTSAGRAVLGADGVVAGWDYDASLTWSRNDQSDSLRNGWVSLSRLQQAMATGLVNPFGESGPEGDALLAGTQVMGETHAARGTTLDFLVKGSRELVALPGGPLVVALGMEARRERLDNAYTSIVTEGDVLGIPIAFQSASGSRNAQALFAEASLPFAAGFEAQAAVRYDHYSDFGSTTNPKFALRWQPDPRLLLRSSWGQGFRAPPIYDLHTPQQSSFLLFYEDPLRCPTTGADTDCIVLPAVNGGNPDLRPETSEQFSAGIVFEPVRGLSIAVDYWNLRKSNLIGGLFPETVLGHPELYGDTNIVRGPVDPLYPTLPGPIENVILTQQNLGTLKTSGIDVDIAWRGPATPAGRFSFSLNGTYIAEWKLQPQGSALGYVSALGRNGTDVPGPIPRWRHHASLGWQYGAWSGTLAQTFQSGYEDVNLFNTVPPPTPRQVSNYEVWDVQGRYTGWKNTTVVLGIKNLLDRDPPFSNQVFFPQVGYDPSYADPRGRTWYLQLAYAFR